MVSESEIGGMVEVAQNYFQKITVGVIILLVGFGLGILVKKLLQRLLTEIGLNKIMSKIGITEDLEKGISSAISYLIYLITIIFFLNKLGITSVILYIVLGGVIMLLILTVLVGLKDIIPNFVAWLWLQHSKNIEIGRKVEVREISGRVERIGYLETEIKTDGGDLLYVPNNLFMKNKFKVKR